MSGSQGEGQELTQQRPPTLENEISNDDDSSIMSYLKRTLRFLDLNKTGIQGPTVYTYKSIYQTGIQVTLYIYIEACSLCVLGSLPEAPIALIQLPACLLI